MNPSRRFSSQEATKVAGISYRQLQYWDVTGMVPASRREGQGATHFRYYTLLDMLTLYTVSRVHSAGVSLQTIRGMRLAEKLRDMLSTIPWCLTEPFVILVRSKKGTDPLGLLIFKEPYRGDIGSSYYMVSTAAFLSEAEVAMQSRYLRVVGGD